MGPNISCNDGKPSTICLTNFQRSNLVIKCSKSTFNQVDPEQGMEWINGQELKGDRIIGITKTTSALCRLTLSYEIPYNNIAAETHTLDNMGLMNSRIHYEVNKSWIKRDNDDENEPSIFKCLKSSQLLPIHSCCKIWPQKIMLQRQFRNCLLFAKVLGQECVNRYIK